MGRTRNKRSRTTKNKSYSKQHATCNRRRDIDQIQDDLKGSINSITHSLTRSRIIVPCLFTRPLTHSLAYYEGIEVGKDITFSIETSEDLPGLGQYYCVHCARHFADDATLRGRMHSFTLIHSLTHCLPTCSLTGHILSKLHKRRLKDLQQPQYSKEEAERAAG